MEEFVAWRPEPALEKFRERLIEDIRAWEPQAVVEEPEWASSDELFVKHRLKEAERRLSCERDWLAKEEATVERANAWLSAMRRTFGPEPEGYWDS